MTNGCSPNRNWFECGCKLSQRLRTARRFHSSFGETPSVPISINCHALPSIHSHHVTGGPPPQSIMRFTKSSRSIYPNGSKVDISLGAIPGRPGSGRSPLCPIHRPAVIRVEFNVKQISNSMMRVAVDHSSKGRQTKGCEATVMCGARDTVRLRQAPVAQLKWTGAEVSAATPRLKGSPCARRGVKVLKESRLYYTSRHDPSGLNTPRLHLAHRRKMDVLVTNVLNCVIAETDSVRVVYISR